MKTPRAAAGPTLAPLSRRRFLTGVLAGAAFQIVPRRVLGGTGQPAPNDEITRAVIGVGGMGSGHLGYGGARTLAVCDADAKRVEKALARCPDAKGYRDFREVLGRPDIDVVHIATPPHWHGLMSIAAAQAGKDVWCEKPMTHTIAEGIAVREAVRRHGRIFRINTWFRFEGGYYGFGTPVAPIKKVVDSGVLGWPLRATVGDVSGFSWKFGWSGLTNAKPEPVPPELDYDMWLGPAPYKPYHPHRVHGTFRGYWDYDGGGLGDMGQHYLDPVQYLLGKDDTGPVEISADAPQQHPDAAGSFRSIRMRYADGCEIVLDGGNAEGRRVPFLEGPKGKLHKNLESDVPGLQRMLAALPDAPPRQTNFYDAVRNRRPFALNERNGHRSCTLINLAIIAWRLGRTIKWDPATETIIGDPTATRLASIPMRAPWTI
jgi:predicted dehydrogenase